MAGPRDPRPLLLLALGLSLLVHSIAVVFVPLMPQPEPQPGRLRVRLPQLYRQLEPFVPDQPGLLGRADQGAPAAPALLAEGPSGTVGFAEGPLGNAPLSSGRGLDGFGSGRFLPPEPLQFEPEKVRLPDLDSLALAALKREVEDRQQAGRLHLPDADTTDAESQRRRWARRVVERAITAMGGRDALRAIHELRARVWIEATDHVISGHPPLFPGTIQSVLPYAYPVAAWHFTGRNTLAAQRVEVKASLDPDRPIPAYLVRNPAITRCFYHALFEGRWARIAGRKRKLWEDAEVARWHFLERFLGSGIVLDYRGTEEFEGRWVDVIKVQDDTYAFEYQALFGRDTGLLCATRERATHAEERWYGADLDPGIPRCVTTYKRYRWVQGVLTPHRMERWGGGGIAICVPLPGPIQPHVVVHLRIAYNGQEPDPTPPDLEE